jgi:hypothetical protein
MVLKLYLVPSPELYLALVDNRALRLNWVPLSILLKVSERVELLDEVASQVEVRVGERVGVRAGKLVGVRVAALDQTQPHYLRNLR